MNYYKARELQGEDGKGTGKWHYTCMNDGQGWPVGYCSPWDECPDCKAALPKIYGGPDCKTCGGKRLIRKANPCPGHKTEEEACQHYKQYLLDHAKILGPKESKWPKNKCKVEGCENEGTYLANVDSYEYYELCEQHANKETLTLLVEVGESWVS